MPPFPLLLFYIVLIVLLIAKAILALISALQVDTAKATTEAPLATSLQVISSLSFVTSCFYFLLNVAGLKGSLPFGPAGFVHHLFACLMFLCSAVLDIIILLYSASPKTFKRRLEITNICFVALLVLTALTYAIYSIYNFKTLQSSLGERLQF